MPFDLAQIKQTLAALDGSEAVYARATHAASVFVDALPHDVWNEDNAPQSAERWRDGMIDRVRESLLAGVRPFLTARVAGDL